MVNIYFDLNLDPQNTLEHLEHQDKKIKIAFFLQKKL